MLVTSVCKWKRWYIRLYEPEICLLGYSNWIGIIISTTEKIVVREKQKNVGQIEMLDISILRSNNVRYPNIWRILHYEILFFSENGINGLF